MARNTEDLLGRTYQAVATGDRFVIVSIDPQQDHASIRPCEAPADSHGQHVSYRELLTCIQAGAVIDDASIPPRRGSGLRIGITTGRKTMRLISVNGVRV